MESHIEDLGHPTPPDVPHDDPAPALSLYTFLATDIVGSSELHRRHPAEMVRAMDQHDEVLQSAIVQAGGDAFKHTGDGVMAVFPRPDGAVRAAVEAYQRMQAVGWPATGRPRIRWGIHSGPARPRGRDFFGPALNGVSRLEEAANPDQILISDAALADCGPALSDAGLGVRDLGRHHFKGIEPLQVYQLTGDALPKGFGPLGGKRETSGGNLPADPSRFIGRTREMAAVRTQLTSARIVTLLGPGGIGKTRLACEAARQAELDFPDGIWILHLSPLEAGVDLWPVLASVFGLNDVPVYEKRNAVLRHLSKARALIVIDNCEHILDAVDDLATTLIGGCPGLSLLCTSQRALGLPGEALYEVPPLSHDDGTSAAIKLFIDRAKLISPRFDPGETELTTIRGICAKLENIPLAIEIAAGQLRRYPLDHIAADAAQPEKMRTGSKRGRSGNDRTTLRRTFEWSYGLLDPAAQKVLERLTVFSGSFHEEAAVELCGLDIEDEVDVLDAIDELIDTSHLSAQFEDSRRFRLLLTVRAFGREKLVDQGMLEPFQKRHGEVYARRSADLGARFATAAELDAARAVLEELDNLRAAFERALDSDLPLAARIVAPLHLFNYYHRGAETAAWAARVMARDGADGLDEAPLLLACAASYSLHELGEEDTARTYLDRGHRIEARGAATSRGWLAHVAGHVALWSGQTEAFLAHHEAAVAQARHPDHGDLTLDVIDTSTAAFVSGTRKDADRAARLVAHLDAAQARVTQPSLVGYIHFGRAGLAMAHGSDSVVTELESAMEWGEIGGNMLGAQRAKRALTDQLSRGSAPERQIALHSTQLRDLPQQGATIYVWLAINRLLAPLAALGRLEELAVLAGALSASPIQRALSGKYFVDEARQTMGSDAFDAAFAKGQRFDAKTARTFAENLGAPAPNLNESR